MTTIQVTTRESDASPKSPSDTATVAIIGNPNAGKTSLFNRLTGLRAKTANFPGTTVEHRLASLTLDDHKLQLIDLPGLYSLDAITPEEKVARAALLGEVESLPKPDVCVIVLDATNIERNLFFVSQALELKLPTIVAANQIDVARKTGAHLDTKKIAAELGCPVIPLSARTGEGMDQLKEAIGDMLDVPTLPTCETTTAMCDSCRGCGYAARYNWAEQVVNNSGIAPAETHGHLTEAIDRFLTHRIVGVLAFGLVMLGTFYLLFSLASYPMDMVEWLFGTVGSAVASVVPEGDIQSLLVDGVIAGVGGMLVFLPQICILFFLIALLEDSGYLARAAFVMDKLMHKVGLPGKAFVPMLSAHACAIPAIMSTRVIESHRDRMATMLVIPMLTCSARLPVYLMIAILLFPNSWWSQTLLFAGAYMLGIVMAVIAAFVLKKTLLPGKTSPMVIELPNYRVPSIRNALLLTMDRAWVFIKTAGTIILVISIVLWALATYPKMDESQMPADVAAKVTALQTEAEAVAGAQPELAAELSDSADNLIAGAELEHSFAGRIGHIIEPVFRPLGFDWKISVGVVSSFAAREVVVSSLAVIYGLSDETDPDDPNMYAALQSSTWPDGTPVFTVATGLSLLVFFVLAMQCLPTQAATKRETNSWKWPIFQLIYMTVLAYVAALIVYQVAAAMGGA